MGQRTLVTTDSHISTPWTLADDLPEEYRQQVPHLEQRDDGLYFVRPIPPGFERMAQMMAGAGGAVKVDPDQINRMAQGNCLPEANPGTSPGERLVEMARDGIAAEVLIGAGGFGVTGGPDLQRVWCRLTNDWLAEAYADHMDKFAPGITLPLDDMNAAVLELERAAGLGLRPILLPEAIWAKPFYEPYWEPLWEAAEGLAVPVIAHLGGARSVSAPWRPSDAPFVLDRPPKSTGAGFSFISVGMAETVGWFVMGGVLERHPDLTVVFTECFGGWLKWAMDHFDNQVHSGVAAAMGVELEALPSDYIRRQVKATFMWDPTAIALRHEIGIENLMWGNDYPHAEGLFLQSQEFVEQQFSGVPENEIDQIVRANACEVYGLQV
jgi:predicted TIM-barrel fold metal-dependent hydrolase